MPLYEFRCADCSAVMTALRKVDQDAEGLRCPACGSERLVRKMSTFASKTANGARAIGETAAPARPHFG